MRIAFATLGCKVNQYETESLIELFSSEGFDVVGPQEEADVYVVNSCTVTSSGDRKSRQLLRRMKKQNPAAKIALTGCFPQAFPKAAEQILEADIITGSYNRLSLLQAVKKALATGERIIDITPHTKRETFEPMRVLGLHGRTRAFVKIEDGCERYCSYCIIPTARGSIRSKAPKDIRQELEGLVKNGYQEVVLVGINLSSYGKDLGLRLIDAVKLACSIEGLCRVRLGSLEPELLSDQDLEEMAGLASFCPQFHLSLQSGCDRTLKAMNRHYDCAEYRRIVDKIRKTFDNPSITTDIMVGFPGETEEDFLESMAFAEEIGFAKAHVFAYSRREGTVAARRLDQIPNAVKESRSRRMIEVADQTRRAFLRAQIGREETVLLETAKDHLGYEGFTKNYTPVSVDCDSSLSGKIVKVRMITVLDDRCVGVLI